MWPSFSVTWVRETAPYLHLHPTAVPKCSQTHGPFPSSTTAKHLPGSSHHAGPQGNQQPSWLSPDTLRFGGAVRLRVEMSRKPITTTEELIAWFSSQLEAPFCPSLWL